MTSLTPPTPYFVLGTEVGVLLTDLGGGGAPGVPGNTGAKAPTNAPSFCWIHSAWSCARTACVGTTPGNGVVMGAPVGDMGGGAGLLVLVVVAGEDAVDTASSGQKPLYGANPSIEAEGQGGRRAAPIGWASVVGVAPWHAPPIMAPTTLT